MTNHKQVLPGAGGFLRRSLGRIARVVAPEWMRSRERRMEFQGIYRKKLWGAGEQGFFSGAGSYGLSADTYVDTLSPLLEGHIRGLGNAATIVDLGCGDFAIGSRLLAKLPPVRYIGCDVVPELIAHNQAAHGTPAVGFQVLDMVRQTLPDGDICLIRQVFQHLPNRDIELVLPKLRNFKFVYVTEAQPLVRSGPLNPDKPVGGDVRFDWSTGTGRGVELDQPPYQLRVEEICRMSHEAAGGKEVVLTQRIFL